MGHDVFISYSTGDKPVADAACARLEQRGHRCWLAPRDILPGQEWGEAIINGISGARVFVLIFSGNANSSPQVGREVERAVSHGLPIVPFRIEDVAPARSLEYFISNQHWLDAFAPPLDRHLDALADVITRLLGEPPRPARAAVASPPPPMPGPAFAAPAAPAEKRRSAAWWWAGGAVGAAALGLLLFIFYQLRPTASAAPEPAQNSQSATAPQQLAPPANVPAARPAAEAKETPRPPPPSPSLLFGDWSGVVIEPWSEERPQYPIAVRIAPDANGEPQGTVLYSTFPCSGTWRFERQRETTWRFRETITEGQDNCEPSVIVDVEATTGGQFINIQLRPLADQQFVSRGTLHRAAGGP